MPFQPILGRWYLAVTCNACKCKVLLFRDLNNGNGNINGSYALVCPQCTRKGSFDIEHYHHDDTEKSNLCIAGNLGA